MINDTCFIHCALSDDCRATAHCNSSLGISTSTHRISTSLVPRNTPTIHAQDRCGASISRCRGARAAGRHRPAPSVPEKPLQHAGPRRSSLPAGVHPQGASRRQQQRASPTSPTRWPLAYRLPQLARSFTSRCSSSRSRFAGSPPELRDARPPPPAPSGAFGPRGQRLPRAVPARVPAGRRRSGRRTAQDTAGRPARLCLRCRTRTHSQRRDSVV